MGVVELSYGAQWTGYQCGVCGERQEGNGVRSVVRGEGISDALPICRTCLSAGASGAIQRAANRGRLLREEADWLEGSYSGGGLPETLRAVTSWKGSAEYDRVRREGEVEREKEGS